MIRFLVMAFAVIFPLLLVSGYALFLLCVTAPVSAISIEKAGQFGDSFGIVTCLFSGLAFSGVLITLYLQREAIKRSEHEHAQNTKLTALAALLGVYHELADKKQKELEMNASKPPVPGSSGQVLSAYQDELNHILKTRDSIYTELEKAANLK